MKKLLVYLFLLCPALVWGQEFLWNVNLDTRFDNREYEPMKYGLSETLFSNRLSPSVGLGWMDKNSIQLGVDVWINMGAELSEVDPTLTFYYQYLSDKYVAKVGLLPRSSVIGNYSRAFFSDSMSYYSTNIKGILLQYKPERGYLELALDWISGEGETSREKFMVFSSGEMTRGVFFMGYNFSMYHLAGSQQVRGVVDNLLVQPYVGLDFSEKTPLSKLKLRASWLNGFQNDRKYVGEYVTPGGYEINFNIEKWKVGIDNTFYMGDNLMPYYSRYTSELYCGSSFYQSNLYNRLEVYWNPVHNRFMELKISSVHYYDGSNWGCEQVARLVINIGKGTFKSKK